MIRCRWGDGEWLSLICVALFHCCFLWYHVTQLSMTPKFLHTFLFVLNITQANTNGCNKNVTGIPSSNAESRVHILNMSLSFFSLTCSPDLFSKLRDRPEQELPRCVYGSIYLLVFLFSISNQWKNYWFLSIYPRLKLAIKFLPPRFECLLFTCLSMNVIELCCPNSCMCKYIILSSLDKLVRIKHDFLRNLICSFTHLLNKYLLRSCAPV